MLRYCNWSDFSEEALLTHVTGLFNAEVNRIISSIPHRVIAIDNQDPRACGAMFFSGDYRELHIYRSKTEYSFAILKIYSIYNGHPMEGGRMEGYTFSRQIEIPSAQADWSDEKLIAEYEHYFKKRQ